MKKASAIFRWAARILSLVYTGFFLFMVVGEITRAGQPNSAREFGGTTIIGFVLLGLYFLSLLLAWKWQAVFGRLSLLFILIFIFAVKAWSAPFLLIGILPPVLYILADRMQSRISEDS